MITREDTVVAFSNSGETAEILTIVPHIKRIGVPLIALTGNPSSRLARDADVNIDVSVSKEACPLGLAPTASTTAALAMGDANRDRAPRGPRLRGGGLRPLPPGGAAGAAPAPPGEGPSMHTGNRMPMVGPDTLASDALVEMTAKSLGHDLRRGTGGDECSASSPTVTCAGLSTPESISARPPSGAS